MKPGSPMAVVRRARQALWRTPVTAVLTTATVAVVVGACGAALGAGRTIRAAVADWRRGSLQMVVFLVPRTGDGAVAAVRRKIERQGHVTHLRYVSPTDALEEMRAALAGSGDAFAGIDPAVLPGAFEVTLARAALERGAIERVAARLRRLPGVEEVAYPARWAVRAQRFLGALRPLALAVGVLMLAGLATVVSNTVALGLVPLRDEVELLRLVGASESFIRGPYILLGVLEGLLGAALGLGAAWAMFGLVWRWMIAGSGWQLTLPRVEVLDAVGIAVLLALGGALGGGGSALALRRLFREHP